MEAEADGRSPPHAAGSVGRADGDQPVKLGVPVTTLQVLPDDFFPQPVPPPGVLGVDGVTDGVVGGTVTGGVVGGTVTGGVVGGVVVGGTSVGGVVTGGVVTGGVGWQKGLCS